MNRVKQKARRQGALNRLLKQQRTMAKFPDHVDEKQKSRVASEIVTLHLRIK